MELYIVQSSGKCQLKNRGVLWRKHLCLWWANWNWDIPTDLIFSLAFNCEIGESYLPRHCHLPLTLSITFLTGGRCFNFFLVIEILSCLLHLWALICKVCLFSALCLLLSLYSFVANILCLYSLISELQTMLLNYFQGGSQWLEFFTPHLVLVICWKYISAYTYFILFN